MSDSCLFRLRIKTYPGGEQVFKCLITRRSISACGNKRSTSYIQDFTVSVDGEPYYYLMMGENTARHPYAQFSFSEPVMDGQTMRISWRDNHGKETSQEFVLMFDEKNAMSTNSNKLKNLN